MFKNVSISIRVEEKIKKAADIAAKEDYRSLASLVEKLLIEYLKDNNYLT